MTTVRMLAFGAALVVGSAFAQDRPYARGATTQDPPVSEVQGRHKTTTVAGEAGWNAVAEEHLQPPSAYDLSNVTLAVKLLHPERSLRAHAADVQVTVRGIQLVDPDVVGTTARPGQGHLAYRVDEGPVIHTTHTKLAFHELPPGKHEILVQLIANDGTPLGPHEVLHVTIP